MNDATDTQPPARGRGASFWITLVVIVAIVLAYVVLVTRPSIAPPGTEGPAIGHRLGYLELEKLTGDAAEHLSLNDLQGRVTLLNFWGTWCPPCVREFPDIVELHQRFGGREDFRLVAVSCGQGDDRDIHELRAETESFLAAAESTLPTYADPGAATRRSMVMLLGMDGMAYPTTLVLDRAGVVRGFWQGYHPSAGEAMGQLIEQLLDAAGTDTKPAAEQAAAR